MLQFTVGVTVDRSNEIDGHWSLHFTIGIMAHTQKPMAMLQICWFQIGGAAAATSIVKSVRLS